MTIIVYAAETIDEQDFRLLRNIAGRYNVELMRGKLKSTVPFYVLSQTNGQLQVSALTYCYNGLQILQATLDSQKK